MLYRKKKDARAGKGDVALWHNVAALRPSATRVGGNELAEHVYLITAEKATARHRLQAQDRFQS